MSILGFVVLFLLVGVVMWAINSYLPMQANIKKLLNVVVTIVMVVIAIVFLMSLFGVSTGSLSTPHRIL